MLDSTILKGYFYMPGIEGTEVAGILTFDPEKVQLELFGSLVDEDTALFQSSIPAIFGYTQSLIVD